MRNLDQLDMGSILRQSAKDHRWNISTEELEAAINRLSWNKALGVDGMLDKHFHNILKNNATGDIEWLRGRIEYIINSDYWPQYMFSARPVLLSKDGLSTTTIKNTRIVSVIPAIAKLIERIILNRLTPSLYGDGGLIPNSQQGFRPNAGTTDQLSRFLAMGEIALAKESIRRKDKARPADRDKCYIGLVDMRAAFDRVDRRKLLTLMAAAPISPEITTAVAKVMNSTSFTITGD